MKLKVKENNKKIIIIIIIIKKTHCPVSEPIGFNTKKSTREQLFVAFYFSLLDIMSAFYQRLSGLQLVYGGIPLWYSGLKQHLSELRFHSP